MEKLTKKEQNILNGIYKLRGILIECGSNRVKAYVTHVAPSGMSRRVKFYTQDGKDMTPLIAYIMERTINDKGILVRGCGVDVIFATLYNINCLANRLEGNEYNRNKACNYIVDTNYDYI